MDKKLGPRWFDTGEGFWQHEETGRIVEGDDMGPFVPSAQEQEYAGDVCPDCGGSALWEECDQCSGEGEFDWETLQFEDPLWYSPGDIEPCEQCEGKGGWLLCLSHCHKKAKGESHGETGITAG